MPATPPSTRWIPRYVFGVAATLSLIGFAVAPAHASSTSNVLHGFAAVSSNDAWATGYYISGGIDHTLSEHWNGVA